MPINSFDDYPMSWKPTVDRNAKSIYLFLANQLERDIKEGALLPGTKLPPQRELADFLDINVSTVTKAFKTCELKGLLSATVGRGTFVSYDALSNAYLLDHSKPKANIIEMGTSTGGNSSYEQVLIQLKQMLNDDNYDRWFDYARQDDVVWQKDAAIKFMAMNGYNTTLETILFANGGQNSIAAAFLGLCKYGDKIGVDPHTLSGVKTLANSTGVQLVPIKQNNDEMDDDILEYACKNEHIKGIYLIPECHNPTTHRMSRERRRAIAEIARKYNVFIIEDAIFPLMYEKQIEPIASLAPDNTIYIASASKIIAPGLRFAYISVPIRYKKAVMHALYNMNVSVSPLISELVARIIVSNSVADMVARHRNFAAERNRLVDKILVDFECKGNESSVFRWLKLPKNVTGQEFEMLALREGVQVFGAERFAIGNTRPERAVRLAICTPKTIKELEAGLVALRNLLYTMM